MTAPEAEEHWDGLCMQLQALGDGYVAGLGVVSKPSESEEADLIVDVFNVPEDVSLEFHRKAYPLLRAARKATGEVVTLVTHTPEVTQRHFREVVESVRTRTIKPHGQEQPLANKVWELTTSAMLAELVQSG